MCMHVCACACMCVHVDAHVYKNTVLTGFPCDLGYWQRERSVSNRIPGRDSKVVSDEGPQGSDHSRSVGYHNRGHIHTSHLLCHSEVVRCDGPIPMLWEWLVPCDLYTRRAEGDGGDIHWRSRGS